MANVIKGLTVEIGGDTTKLGKALEDVNKKSRDLTSELGQINKLLKMDPGNADLLAQKQKVLAEAVKNTAEKLKTLKEAEKQVQAQFERGEVSEEQVRALQREIIETERKMADYKKAARETAEQIDKLGDESDDAKKDVDELGDEAKDTGKELDDAGDKASKFGENAKKAGEVAVKGLAAVATAVAAAGAALVKATHDAAAYADEILTASTVTGISTEKLQAYGYAAELVDVSVETMTKSHAKNIKSMKAAQDGTALAVEAYEKLGVSVMNADGSLRDGETVYWEVIDALGKMENETERDAVAMQILGKSAQELNPMIEAGAAKMQELTEEAKEVGAVMSEGSLQALGQFDDAIQRMKGSAGAAKNAIGTVLLPELTALTKDGTDLLSEFTRNLNESGGGMEGFVATLDQMSGRIGEKAGEVVSTIISKASSMTPAIIDVGTSLVTTLVTSLASQAPQLVEAGIGAILALIQGLTGAIPQLTAAFSDMLPQLVSVLEKGTPMLLDAAVGLLLAIIDAIDLLLPPLIEAIPRIVTAVVGALTNPETLQKLIAGALTLFLAIADAIPLLIQKLTPLIPSIVLSVCSALLKCSPQILGAGVTVLGALATAVPKACTGLLKALPKIWTTISSYLLQLPSKVVGIGKDLVAGLWKGINDKYTWIKNKIKSWVGNVTSFLKKLFGINSPSKVTAYMGEMLSAGLAKGIEDTASEPINAMGDLSKDMLAEAGGVDGLALERQISHSYRVEAAAQTAQTAGMLGKLDQILRAIESGKVIALNGDLLVGGTVNAMNSALGQRRVLSERGAV